jgi:hypothetical protein
VDVGSALNAGYACSDAGSGLATCDGDVADGAALSTSQGKHTLTVTATDTAGNVTTKTVKYNGGPPDDDADTVPDAGDNCPSVANTAQTNTDGDALGDLCDPDDDNDGVYDQSDQCPATASGTTVAADGCIPPPATTPPPATKPPPAKPSAAVTVPVRCVSRRFVRIHIGQRYKNLRVRSVTGTMNGKTLRLRRTHGRWSITVDMRGRGRMTVRVSLTLRFVNGPNVQLTRAYRTCRPGPGR